MERERVERFGGPLELPLTDEEMAALAHSDPEIANTENAMFFDEIRVDDMPPLIVKLEREAYAKMGLDPDLVGKAPPPTTQPLKFRPGLL